MYLVELAAVDVCKEQCMPLGLILLLLRIVFLQMQAEPPLTGFAMSQVLDSPEQSRSRRRQTAASYCPLAAHKSRANVEGQPNLAMFPKVLYH